jgi:hypothetical protein
LQERIGRLLRPMVRQRVFAGADLDALPVLEGWPHLITVLAVENIRSVIGTGKVTAVIRCYLSSRKQPPEQLATAMRRP